MLTLTDARNLLNTKFAAWIRDLNLAVETLSPSSARLVLPYSERLSRVGGTVCGLALMACAETAMVIAVSSALGEFRNMTTIGQTISFMRPIANSDVMIEARVLKLGRSIVFGEVSMMAAGQDAVAAHATTSYASIT